VSPPVQAARVYIYHRHLLLLLLSRVGFLPAKTCFCQTCSLNRIKLLKAVKTNHNAGIVRWYEELFTAAAILDVDAKIQETRFSGKLSNSVSCKWAFKEPIIGSLKSKMAEIRHLENRHDVIFLQRVVQFGKKFGGWCRMTCRLR